MAFMLVRWLGSEPGYRSGSRSARLPKVGFVEYLPNVDNFAFGFLDPKQIVRGCHLIPDFRSGQGLTLLPFHKTVARQQAPLNTDWLSYYVNVFVDRDMVMRYYGGGVGHFAQAKHIEDLDPTPEGDQIGDDHPSEPTTSAASELDDSDSGSEEGTEDGGSGDESDEDSEDDGDDGHYASD